MIHDNWEGEMKTLGAILAVLGILAVAVGALRHFSPFILPSTTNASLFIVIGGIVVMILGAVIARLGGESDGES
jgi:membrane protein implicated in regulation of membrane protease activity